MIITVTLNPSLDKYAYVDTLKVNELNRINIFDVRVAGKGINASETLKLLNTPSVMTGFMSLKYKDDFKDFIFIKEDIRTNLKIIDAKCNLTEINENGPTVSKYKIKQLFDKLEALLDKNTVLILSGSVSKSIDPNIYYDLITFSKIKGCKIILDSDDEYLANGIKANPHIIKPNKTELCKLLKLKIDSDINILIDNAKKLLNEELSLIVLSLGKDGAYFITKERVYYVKAVSCKVKSPIGAGDAMVAGIAYSIKNHFTLEDTIKFGVACATMAISEDTISVDDLIKKIKIKKI